MSIFPILLSHFCHRLGQNYTQDSRERWIVMAGEKGNWDISISSLSTVKFLPPYRKNFRNIKLCVAFIDLSWPLLLQNREQFGTNQYLQGLTYEICALIGPWVSVSFETISSDHTTFWNYRGMMFHDLFFLNFTAIQFIYWISQIYVWRIGKGK